MRYRFLPLVLSLAAAPGLAETCKYVDKDGRTIYSNVPVKNARKVACFQPPPAPSPEPSTAPANARSPAPADTSRARVEPNTQRQRDSDRRQILESELAREQDALNEAKKALAEQESVREGSERNYARVQERLKPYQDSVALHEKNIASLKQEIANLK
jgi:septal ring factor EnvC (AmiA/AmiB activator)